MSNTQIVCKPNRYNSNSSFVGVTSGNQQYEIVKVTPVEPVSLPPMPMTGINQVVHYNMTPEGRARVLLAKSLTLGGYLSIGTFAAMFVFGQFALFAWLALASLEFFAAFIYIARQDYHETPASQQHKMIDGYLRMLEREQKTRLKAQYGEVIE